MTNISSGLFSEGNHGSSAFWQEHCRLLLGVSERGDWRAWLLFFLRGVAEQARDPVARARRLQDLREEWHRRLAQARTSALLLRLADALFDSPILTIPQAQQWLGVTYPSAQRNVERLIEAGILQPVGQVAYGKTYLAAEIMRVIGEEATP